MRVHGPWLFSLFLVAALVACGPSAGGPAADDDTEQDQDSNLPLDEDRDGDGISDRHDGSADRDGDGTANLDDDDSDGDGFSDADEAGDGDLASAPADVDGDGTPDFLDGDSDDDGLPDADELAAGTDRADADSDGDGHSDLAEVVIHEMCVADPSTCNGDPDPLDPDKGVSPLDFVFVLPYEDPPQTAPLDFSTDLARADVQFSMDTTGSMSAAITGLRGGLQEIIAQVSDPATGIPDTAFGVSRYEDFPLGGYGGFGDLPFLLHQRVTTSPTEAQGGVNALDLGGGGDTPESGWEALYQIATGAGVGSWVAPFDPTVGYDPARHGTLGGVGFRAGALPIVVQVSDAASHQLASGGACNFSSIDYDPTIVVGAHDKDEAIAALTGIGARVIGIASQSFSTDCGPRGDMEAVAAATGATVAPAAWGTGAARPNGCAANQCCTGVDGRGLPPVAGACPLVFDVPPGSTGFVAQIVSAIRTLARFGELDISGAARGEEQPTATGALIDPAGFIRRLTPVALDPAPAGGPQIAGDVFLDVQPGTTATFDVEAHNTIVPRADAAQVFTLSIDVLGDAVSVLDTRQVVVIVPAGSEVVE